MRNAGAFVQAVKKILEDNAKKEAEEKKKKAS